MVTLNPYLTFDGTAREAMEFYREVFGGELTVSTFGDMGTEGDLADGVMHAQLTGDHGLTLMASDMPPGEEFRAGTGMSVSLSGDEADLLRGWWQRLVEGGAVTVPLEMQMWGDEFGMLVDEFGMTWMVNITGPQNAG